MLARSFSDCRRQYDQTSGEVRRRRNRLMYFIHIHNDTLLPQHTILPDSLRCQMKTLQMCNNDYRWLHLIAAMFSFLYNNDSVQEKEQKKTRTPYQDNDFILAACSLQTCNVECASKTDHILWSWILCSFCSNFVIVAAAADFFLTFMVCFFTANSLSIFYHGKHHHSIQWVKRMEKNLTKKNIKVIRFLLQIKLLELKRIRSNELWSIDGRMDKWCCYSHRKCFSTNGIQWAHCTRSLSRFYFI